MARVSGRNASLEGLHLPEDEWPEGNPQAAPERAPPKLGGAKVLRQAESTSQDLQFVTSLQSLSDLFRD